MGKRIIIELTTTIRKERKYDKRSKDFKRIGNVKKRYSHNERNCKNLDIDIGMGSMEIKNIGEARADFVKINFIFRMNWQGKTKSLTAYVRGSKHTFTDPNIETDSSIEIDAIAAFELVIPPDFGEFIGYSYTIDWEQYDD